MPTIVVSAVVMRNERGEVLHVRKRGTSMFMLPGGKPEAGETFAETAMREFYEELGGELHAATLTPLGTFSAAAANEPGHEVVGHVFAHPRVTFDGPQAEIDELVWIDPSATDDTVAPMSRTILAELSTR